MCAKSLRLPLAFRWLRWRISLLPDPITSSEAILGFPGWLRIKWEAALYRIADSRHIFHRCYKNTSAPLLHPPVDSVSTLEHIFPACPKEIPTFLLLPTEKPHYLLYDGMFPGFLFQFGVLHQQHAMRHA